MSDSEELSYNGEPEDAAEILAADAADFEGYDRWSEEIKQRRWMQETARAKRDDESLMYRPVLCGCCRSSQCKRAFRIGGFDL